MRGLFCLVAAFGAAGAQEPAAPITDQVWQEAVVSVTDLDRTAEFFIEIGAYETKWRGPMDPTEIAAWNLDTQASAEAMLIGPPGQDTGLIRLVRFDDAGRKAPIRPGSRAWDTGCFFSLMVRMKDMPSIFDDAIRMGWWTETPMTYLEFGESRLNVMVFRGPDGVQVQGYERLSPPLPDEIPAFERMTRPFNIMQMVRDRDASYSFFTELLGFGTFYNGEPFVSPEPEFMPLGIPRNLTTEVRYRAGIVHPVPGEFGRMEMIEIMDLDGRDFAENCVAPNLGILAVRFPVADTRDALYAIVERGGGIETFASGVLIEPYGELRLFNVKTPDGANVHFYEILRSRQLSSSGSR